MEWPCPKLIFDIGLKSIFDIYESSFVIMNLCSIMKIPKDAIVMAFWRLLTQKTYFGKEDVPTLRILK